MPLKNEITFLIKTFERPKIALRLIKSIREFYPDVRVIVADDGQKYPLQQQAVHNLGNVDILKLPYDTGLSEGRNKLMEATETPYFLLLDDDFVFTHETIIERLLPFLRAGVFDIAGGALRLNGQKVVHFEGFIEKVGTTLHCTHKRHVTTPSRCDVILNFFAASTDKILKVKWNPVYKMGEHLDFFWRCKDAGIKVGYVPNVIADHVPYRTKEYNSIRYTKADEGRALFRKNRGITHVGGSLNQ